MKVFWHKAILSAVILAGLTALTAQPTQAEWVKNPTFETVAPELPKELKRPAILILTKANGWRHDNMPAAAVAVTTIARKHHWPVYDTANAAVFNTEQLKRFDVVVLNNVTGDVFTPEQREAFKTWIEAGGRVVALHGAGGTNDHPWTWYIDGAIGAGFKGHPKIQDGVVHIEDPAHPAMRGLPKVWPRNEEWYSFDRDPRGPGVHVLATVDETSYDPTDKLRMGADHPIIWTKCVGKGGVFFSALGHQIKDWSEPVFLSHIEGAMEWARDPKSKMC
jgi:type 1 glutamine amidotransferase